MFSHWLLSPLFFCCFRLLPDFSAYFSVRESRFSACVPVFSQLSSLVTQIQNLVCDPGLNLLPLYPKDFFSCWMQRVANFPPTLVWNIRFFRGLSFFRSHRMRRLLMKHSVFSFSIMVVSTIQVQTESCGCVVLENNSKVSASGLCTSNPEFELTWWS